MAFALFNCAIAYFCSYFYFQNDYVLYAPMHSVHATLELWIFPSIYLYIKSIVIPDNKLKKEWKHFLLGGLMFVIATILFYFYVGIDDLIFFMKHNKEGYHFIGLKFQILIITRYLALATIALQAVFYSIAFVRIPKEYDIRLKNEFSNIDNFSLNWINRYNLFFGISGLIGFISYTFSPIKGLHELLILFCLFIFSAFICTMGVVAQRQKKPLKFAEEIEFDKDLNTVSEVIIDESLINKLIDYMETKKPFLQPDLSLTIVCEDLGINRTYLSNMINKKFGVNFNTYINDYRVRFLIDYIEKNPSTSREQLVDYCGFGSLRTMTRAMNRVKTK